MSYRQNKGTSITREEINQFNELVAKVGFKIPDLWDPQFLASLSRTHHAPQETKASSLSEPVLERLKKDLVEMTSHSPQQRGFRFEKFLGEVFEAFDLVPRSAFRLVGEQIDGSLQFQGETYLVEGKWQNNQIGQEDLLTFSGKVGGKAQWSRGLFISYSSFTSTGLDAFARGRPTNIICMDGFDFHCTLEGKLDLRAVLERKARRAAETNEAYVSVGTFSSKSLKMFHTEI